MAGMLAAFRVIEDRLPKRSLLGSLIDPANLEAQHSTACSVGESYLVIERPIANVHATDALGSIRADTIGMHNVPVQEKSGCRDCTWQLRYAGGCPVATFCATGRYDVQSPNCGIYQALYPAAVRLEGLRVLKYGWREYFGAV